MSSPGRARRDANQYTVEVVVAVDQEMMDYYGGDLYDVILTAMNLTSDVYQQSNLKQSISISVLEIIQSPFATSEFEDSPGTDGKNAQKMLTKFCDYMKETDVKYDAAMFITKYSILIFYFLERQFYRRLLNKKERVRDFADHKERELILGNWNI